MSWGTAFRQKEQHLQSLRGWQEDAMQWNGDYFCIGSVAVSAYQEIRLGRRQGLDHNSPGRLR